TYLLDTLVSMVLPIIPPMAPPATIYHNIDKSKSPKPVVKVVVSREDICEKKIIKVELAVAALAVIEKPSVKIAMFKGPPPIPRNAAIRPSLKPISKIKKAWFN